MLKQIMFLLPWIIVKSRCALLTGEMTVVLRLLLDRVTVFINFNHVMFLRVEAIRKFCFYGRKEIEVIKSLFYIGKYQSNYTKEFKYL